MDGRGCLGAPGWGTSGVLGDGREHRRRVGGVGRVRERRRDGAGRGGGQGGEAEQDEEDDQIKIKTTKIILRHQMISNENLINIKVVEVMKIYKFYFGHLVI